MDQPLIRLAAANGIKITGIHEWPDQVDEDVKKFVANPDARAIFVVEEPDGLIIGPPPRSTEAYRTLVVVKPRGVLPEENWDEYVIAMALPLSEGAMFSYLHALLAQTVLPLFDSGSHTAGAQARHKIVEAARALEQLSRHTQIAFVDLQNGTLANRARAALSLLEQEGRDGQKANSTVAVQNLNELQSVVNTWKQQVSKLVSSDRDVREGSASDEIGFWIALESALHNVEEQLASPFVQQIWAVLEDNKRFHATRNFGGDTGLSEAYTRVQGYTQALFRDLPLGELLAAVSVEQLINSTYDVFSHFNRKLRSSAYPAQRSIGFVEAIGRDFASVLLKITETEMDRAIDNDDTMPDHAERGARIVAMVSKIQKVQESVSQAAEAWDAVVREFATLVRDLMRKRAERFMVVKVAASHNALVNRVNAIATLATKHGELWPLLNPHSEVAEALDSTFHEIITDEDFLTIDDTQGRKLESQYARVAQAAEISIAEELKSHLEVAEKSGSPTQILNVFMRHHAVLSRPQVRAVTHKFQSSLLDSTKQELLKTEKSSRSLPEGDIVKRVIRMQQLELQISDIRSRLSIVIGEDWRELVEAAHIGNVCDSIQDTLNPQEDIKAWAQSVTSSDKFSQTHKQCVLKVKNGEIVVTGDSEETHVIVRDLKALGFRFDLALTNLADSLVETNVAKERINDCLGNVEAVSLTLQSYPRILFVNEVSKASQRAVEYISTGLHELTWGSEEIGVYVTGFEQISNLLDTTVSHVAETDAAISQLMVEAQDDSVNIDMDAFKRKVVDLSDLIMSPRYSSVVLQDTKQVLAKKMSSLLSEWQPPTQKARIEIRNQTISVNPSLPECLKTWIDDLNSLVLPTDMASADVPEFLEKSYATAIQRVWLAWEEAQEEVKKWTDFQILWELRKDQAVEALRESSSSDQGTLDVWLETLDQLHHSQTLTMATNTRLELDTQEASLIIEAKCEGWQDILLENMKEQVLSRSTNLLENSRQARRNLESSRIDMRGVILEGLEFLHTADVIKQSLEHWIPSLIGANRLINGNRAMLPPKWISSDLLQTELTALTSLVQKRSSDLEKAKPTIFKELESRTASLVIENERISTTWQANKPLQANVDPESALKALATMSRQSKATADELDSLSNAFKSLSYALPSTLKSLVTQVQQRNVEIEALAMGWADVSNGWSQLRNLGSQKYFDFTWEEMAKSFNSIKKFVEELPEQSRQMPAFEKLRDYVDQLLSNALPSLQTLKGSSAVTSRHISQIIPDLSSSTAENPSLSDIWLKLPAKDIVSEVVEAAEGEFQLLKYIDLVKLKWDELVLSGKENVIRNLDVVLPLLNDHIAAFNAMSGSPHFKAVSSIVQEWESKLVSARQTFDLFADVQQRHIYLRGILTSETVSTVLPNESRRFRGFAEEFSQIYSKAESRPALEFAGLPRLSVNLTRLLNQFNGLHKSLSGFLETQRKRFPRLLFVGDDDLLEIVGSPIQVWGFKHIPAIFPGVARIDFDDDCVVSPEDERLKVGTLQSGKSDNIEILISLDRQLASSLRNSMISAITQLNDAWSDPIEFGKWLESTPLQSVLIALRERWSRRSLSASLDHAGLSAVEAQYAKLLQWLPKTGDDSILWSRRKESVIAELIYEQRNLKPEFPHLIAGIRVTKGDVCIFCGANEWRHGYEYVGAPEPIVRTSITDDLYLSAMAALAQGKGVSVVGPAGTGKTETVKSLGNLMGRRVVVFNSDDQFDYAGVLRMMKGCGETGSWACFDEFNRLSRSVLSSVAQVVNDSLLKAPVFVTMNPGYSGRTILPPNMRDQFREFVLAAPESKEIARVILYSHGKVEPEGAEKAVELLDVLDRHLSKQSHYDWGLRALKGIIRVGILLQGDIKRACATAIRPRLVTEDIPMFDAELLRLFGDSPDHTGTIELASKSCSANLEIEEQFREFVVSLDIFRNLYAGIMLLGPSGCGKTTVWRELARIHGAETIVIDPSALPKSALIGFLDPITREWTDGLLSSLLRRINANLRGEQSRVWFLVFDGEIEPDWAEALNSLLDENRHLTLSNGEMLQLPSQVHLIFETTNLRAATPATVSRCGMICMPPYVSQSQSLQGIPYKVLDAAKSIEHAMEFIEVQSFESFSKLNLGNRWLSMVWALAGDSDEAGRLIVSDAIRAVASPEELLPAAGSLTDYYVSELTGRWHSWADSVGGPPPLDRDAVNRPDVLIPTVDTVSHEAILQGALTSRRPLILVGPPGSGKTMTLYGALRQMPQVSSLIPLNFSSNASSELIIQALELYCEYSTGADGNRVLSPSGSRWAVLFIDELNLPQPNMYDVVTVLQFIRHLVEYQGFYDRNGRFVKVERLQLVAACNPPPLRRPLPPSLLRHFISVQVNYPKKQALGSIYAAFLAAMDTDAVSLVDPMLSVYEELPKILPNETWTPRELTRWTRSINTAWNAISEAQRSYALLVKIWAYEAQRVLCDRLGAEDRTQAVRLISQNAPNDVNLDGHEIWSYFMSQRPKFVTLSELKEFLKARLSLFMDEAAGEGDNNLVVHDEFVKHVSRLDRVMRQPQGHALLVGAASVGKCTLVRFTCWLLGMSLDILRTHSRYTEADFSHDLRRLLLRSLRRPVCVLLGEDLFSKPDFVELMNSLLANGEVPGLFATADQQTELEEASRRAGFVGGDLISWFRSQVVSNLHIIFSTSEISLVSPALLNRCVVDRVESWSIDVKREIAKHWCSSTDAPLKVIDLLASCFNMSIFDDNNGVSFIESCRQFERAYNHRKAELENSQRHFVSGSDRIKSAVLEIGQLKRKLALRQEQLTHETERSSAVLSQMLHEQSEAERKKVAAFEIRAAVKLQTEQIEERRRIANEDLAATEPLIAQAAEGVQNIKKSQLNELRALLNPPEPVKITLEAVCLVLGLKTDGSWKQVLAAVRGDEFIPRIVHFDTAQLSPQLISKIERDYMSMPSFTYERVDRASKAGGPLLRWVVAQVAYGRAIAAVQPLMEEIRALNNQAEKSRAQLTAIEEMLSDLETAIGKSKNEYSQTVAQCETLKADMHNISLQLQRAESLMGSLSNEKDRWGKAASEFPKKVALLPKQSLMEAANIAYGGKLDPSKKVELMDQIAKSLEPFDNQCLDLLVQDELNGEAIVNHSWSVVLVIDPSNTWTPADDSANVKTSSFLLDSDTLAKELDTALRFGQHLVIQNAERFDPLILPILTRDFVRRGARLLVKLGNGDVDVSPTFRLTLHARDLSGVEQGAPLLLPRVNVVDTSVTKIKFEHIVANELLQAQIPDLADRKSSLKVLQKETNERLKRLELELLSALSGPTTDKILEDKVLVESLEKLKAETLQLQNTQSSTEETLDELDNASRQFKSSARLAADIYQHVMSLYSLDKFYTIGVDWLCEQVRSCAMHADFDQKFNLEIARRVLSVMRRSDWNEYLEANRLLNADIKPLPLLKVIQECPSNKIIIAGLATANASDPAARISSEAVSQTGSRINCSIVPMGSLEACQRADRVLSEAMEIGEWVVIQNVEVANDQWLRSLSRQMQIAKPHSDFRLILTGQQAELIEIPELVTSGRTVSVESERGVKLGVFNSLSENSDETDFAICYIHACFSEKFGRINFGPTDLVAARWFATKGTEMISQLHTRISTLKRALLISVWGARTGDVDAKRIMNNFIDLNLKADPVFPRDFRAWARQLPSEYDWLPKSLAQ